MTVLYGKLRSLLLWLFVPVPGISTRQELGLLDAFTGVFPRRRPADRFRATLRRASDATDQFVARIESGGSGGDSAGDEGRQRLARPWLRAREPIARSASLPDVRAP